MELQEARHLIGCDVSLTWKDRKGEPTAAWVYVHAADFVPLYGPCLITDRGDIRLDRVVHWDRRRERRAA